MFDVDVAYGGNLFEVYVAIDHYGVGLGWQTCGHRADVMLAVVCHDIVGGDEGRNISSCLLGQVWVYLPVVLAAFCTVYCLVNLVGTAVVCVPAAICHGL